MISTWARCSLPFRCVAIGWRVLGVIHARFSASSRPVALSSRGGGSLSRPRSQCGYEEYLACVCLLVLPACGPSVDAPLSKEDVDWVLPLGNTAGHRYSPLSHIDRFSVGQMTLLWQMRVHDFDPEVFDPAGHRAGGRTASGALVLPRLGAPCATCHQQTIRFQTTPSMRWSTLYVSTPLSRVLALDPGTGRVRWTFDPQVRSTASYAEGLVSRGVATWEGPAARSGHACARRVFVATMDARLVALDAGSGELCSDFGHAGMVDLTLGMGVYGGDTTEEAYSPTSPPAVIEDLVIIGGAANTVGGVGLASGAIRAFDVRSGRLRWKFDPIPRAPGDPGWNEWVPEATVITGGANSWSIQTVDPDLHLVFVGTGSAGPNFAGHTRPGRNDLANSVIAIDATDGSVVWWQQLVHHDLWDYDIATQPMLVDLQSDSGLIPLVLVGTKTGMLFTFHRDTGQPYHAIAHHSVPRSTVPEEEAWPTQPMATELPHLHPGTLTADSLFGVSEGDRLDCAEAFERVRYEGLFTPPSLQGTLLWPGYWGGLNWDSMAWDPERGWLVTTQNRLAMVVTLLERGDERMPAAFAAPGASYEPQLGSRYGAVRHPFVAPNGTPCSPPPWGELIAVDITRRTVRWRRPLSKVPWLPEVTDATGSILGGGPLVTAGDLVFVAGGQDDKLRAIDIESGETLWEYELPAGGQAAPMTYRYQGHQYVVIAAGGRAGLGSPGDWVLAFGLPERRGPRAPWRR